MLALTPFGFPLIEFIYLVLGFGFLIFVHELGHFAVAKWVGIRCPQFAIGFGKAMFSWHRHPPWLDRSGVRETLHRQAQGRWHRA